MANILPIRMQYHNRFTQKLECMRKDGIQLDYDLKA